MEKIIIFGTGKRMQELKIRGCFNNYEIIAFCDNDSQKFGKEINSIKIISPEDIYKYDFDFVYITSEKYKKEITNQLIMKCGIPSEKIKMFELKNNKYEGEMSYWKVVYETSGHYFNNNEYKEKMLGIAEQNNDSFWKNKIVVDFGCGPRGSLRWTDTPAIKIGVDVIANRYLEEFGEELLTHDMVYVTSSEKKIPIPSEFADYAITINSMDHVNNLSDMSSELVRILKKDGILLASFNLNEPITECEPQTLTEEILHAELLCNFDIESYRLAHKGEKNIYENLLNNKCIDKIGKTEEAVLWVRARKKG